MPNDQPPSLSAIPLKRRASLDRAMQERTVLGYGFSWAKLRAMLDSVTGGVTDDEAANLLLPCVAAFTSDDADALKTKLSATILAELKACNLKTIRHHDPFGSIKDFMQVSSSSSSFNKQTAMDLLVADYNIPAKEISQVWRRATTSKPYTSLQVRNVKEQGEEGEEA